MYPTWSCTRCPIDPEGQIAGGSAARSLVYWKTVQDRLEGQFVLVRATPRSLQVLTDPLGLYPVYYWQRDGTWLVSNSIAILRTVTAERSWDPLGLSTAAISGWAGADRTLTANIRVMPGGEVRSTRCDAVGLTKHRYFDRAEWHGCRAGRTTVRMSQDSRGPCARLFVAAAAAAVACGAP